MKEFVKTIAAAKHTERAAAGWICVTEQPHTEIIQ